MTSSIVCFSPEVAFPDSSSDVVIKVEKSSPINTCRNVITI